MSKKKLVLYGAGTIGKRYLEKFGTENVYAFADSNDALCKTLVCGKKVLSQEELLAEKENICIFPAVCFEKRESIVESIKKLGLEELITYYPDEDIVKTGDRAYCGSNTKYGGRNFQNRNAYLENSELGYASYIGINSRLEGTEIGKYTSIGSNLKIIRGQHPAHGFVSTHPAFYAVNHTIEWSYVKEQLFEEFRYRADGTVVKIGNDVWIGDDVHIMEGIKIADGSIIAAGAMVVKDTQPYSIVGGNPGRVIGTRFSQQEIEFLLQLKWWEKPEDWIREHAKYFSDIKILIDVVREEA